MIKTIATALCVLAATLFLTAQTDTLPTLKPESKPVKIANCRQELIQSFLMDDPAGVGLWMDSLARLEDENFAGLVWDERWLLYFWTESFGTLLQEVSQFDAAQRELQAWKIQPPRDSLFEWVDWTVNERRFELFGSIRQAFLNEEEKAFTTILLEYLLRMNHDEAEWAERLQSFESHYPASRFLPFLRSIMPANASLLKPAKKAWGISGGIQLGHWRGDIEHALNEPVSFNLDAFFWAERWNILFEGNWGGPRILRDLNVDGFIWPKKDPTHYATYKLMLGYDLFNGSKMRLFPTIGGGFGQVRPPIPDEDDDPLPDYYENFNFFDFHLGAALNLDLKIFRKNYLDWGTAKGSYHGVRLKLGWNGHRFGRQFDGIRGDMLYVSANYGIFAVLPKSTSKL
jgi:hypothetical protein